MYKRFDVGSLVSSAAVQLSPVPFSNLSNFRPGAVVISLTTLSIIMFSKAIITFLAIGALWVNVLAAPIPVGVHFAEDPEAGRPPSFEEDPEPGLNWKLIAGLAGCKLPRSFPALSYRDLTFAFSVVGGLAAGTAIGTGVTAGLLSNHNQNQTKRGFESEPEDSNPVPSLPVSKWEPVSEDEASDSLSSPLKREPEPAPHSF